MLTQSQVDYLLNLVKVVEENSAPIDLAKEKNRLILISPDDDWKFLVLLI